MGPVHGLLYCWCMDGATVVWFGMTNYRNGPHRTKSHVRLHRTTFDLIGPGTINRKICYIYDVGAVGRKPLFHAAPLTGSKAKNAVTRYTSPTR